LQGGGPGSLKASLACCSPAAAAAMDKRSPKP